MNSEWRTSPREFFLSGCSRAVVSLHDLPSHDPMRVQDVVVQRFESEYVLPIIAASSGISPGWLSGLRQANSLEVFFARNPALLSVDSDVQPHQARATYAKTDIVLVCAPGDSNFRFQVINV